LVAVEPDLAAHLIERGNGGKTLDFAHPMAVKRLNQALISHHYGIRGWDFPDGHLCPPVPGRADALHVIADLLAVDNSRKIPRGAAVRGLEIGTGASLIYPLLGFATYGWSFRATDIHQPSLDAAAAILDANPEAAERIECTLQGQSEQIFDGVLGPGELFDFTMSNPPFHASSEAAAAGTRRKNRNVGGRHSDDEALNFSGLHHELVCPGGEKAFIETMIAESRMMRRQVLWFTSLVSAERHLDGLERSLQSAGAKAVRRLEIATGNKRARLLAWTFFDEKERRIWAGGRW
jgi:23S rRNA (adenine1618-N6)-methyltransferase